ncbi:NADPH-dependent FMN reductase [Pseudonocardia endophytica]|uniref:FMN reductase n=1 Tax=Pseudonocardia endophytica TaxID=401976 RepID=A0A4R1HHV5_PSEEN|nr:NADPH-dependent FMN reductase [Pseudonocardia endophytica]TCK21834.1 FMN reductase [Pseudonocardia endophytica]
MSPTTSAVARPARILGIGGTQRSSSSSNRLLRAALGSCRARGAEVELIAADQLEFSMYDPPYPGGDPAVDRYLSAVRAADCLIVATPGYHGGVSGLLKNALDFLQELAGDDRPYLDDKAVGCIVAAAGWQAAVSTLAALRSTVHALRGWPTPLGVTVNSSVPPVDPEGRVTDPHLVRQLDVLADQLTGFARRRADGASAVALA